MRTRRERRAARALRPRWTAVLVAALAIVGVVSGVLITKGTGHVSSVGFSRQAAPAAPVATTVSTAPPTTTTVDPGTLPQTSDRPGASGAAFQARAQGLWDAIVSGDPAAATPFFFPLSAYLQVKAITNPAQDYQQRLVANYATDIATLHAQLGSAASRAVFVGLDVPDSQAVWVTPGSEYNKLPYWRVYGTVVRYTVDGTSRTFSVSSLISWRGEWYVVHLGPIR